MIEEIKVYVIIVTVLVGLCVGSFLNVAIYRIPLGMSLAHPGSHCPKCNYKLKWYDNIPLLSYIVLKGRCRNCKEKISFRYPFVELLNTVLWFLCLMLFTNAIIKTNDTNWYRFICGCVISSTLICIFFSDLDHMEIPEIYQGILLVCGLVLLLEDPSFNTILLKVLGCLGSALLFIIVNFVYKLIKKRDGIGFGDVELVACLGLILGGYKAIFALTISCVVGGIILLIVTLINNKKNKKEPSSELENDKEEKKEYPFAVILTVGYLITMFVGDFVITWYLQLMGVH